MIQVYHIQVPKDRFKVMPKDERAFLLLLGYAVNQILMLQKLLMFSSNKTPLNDLEHYLSAAQNQMLLRLLIGVLNETWLLITMRFLKNKIRKEYQGRIDEAGELALANLNKQFGASNLLNSIRNGFSFHYPTNDSVETAFKAAISDPDLVDDWNLYFSQSGFNSFYFLSEIIIAHGIGKGTGASGLIEAQHKLMIEVTDAARNLFEFSKAFTAAVWIKNFGAEMLARELISIKDAPNWDEPWIPFFVEMKSCSSEQKA